MNQTATATNPLGTEKIGKLMMRFAVPSIIALVVNSLYNMVDQIFIGNGVGYLGNAATNVISPLMAACMAVGLMIGDGCATYMSLNMGKGEQEKAAKGVGNAIVATIGFGIIFTILCESFLEPLCMMFGATEESISYCLAYGRPVALGFTLSAIAGSFTSIIRADGRAQLGMVGMFIGCGVNLILDPIFIFVFHWGVAGAAWATFIGQLCNAVFFAYNMTRCKSVKPEKKNFSLQGKVIGRICVLGFSGFITQFAAVIVLGVLNNLLKNCGANSVYASHPAASDHHFLACGPDFRCIGRRHPGPLDWTCCGYHILRCLAGGTDDLWNLQPMCRSCNSSKRDRQTKGETASTLIRATAHGQLGKAVGGMAKQKLKDAVGIKYVRK